MSNIYAYLRDGTNNKEMTGVYSVGSPGVFEYESVGGITDIWRIMVYYTDDGLFSVQGYGANTTPLTNGMHMHVVDASDAIVTEFTEGDTIKATGDWASLCFDMRHDSFGAGYNAVAARWTFARGGRPITLLPGHKLVAVCQDNMSHLISHRIHVQGIAYDEAHKRPKLAL